MKQLSTDTRNAEDLWPSILMIGYDPAATAAIKKYGKEAEFGALMIQCAKDTGMFNVDKKWCRNTEQALSSKEQNRENLLEILSLIRDQEITSGMLSEAAGITQAAASNRLYRCARAGFIDIAGWRPTNRSGVSKEFSIAQKGLDLLAEVGE